MIYETTPADPKDKGDIQTLIKTLWDNKNIYLSARTIAKMTGYNTRNSCVSLRQDITKLICDLHLPIISNQKGFKWGTNKDEIMAYIQALNNRITGIARRSSALWNIINKGGLENEQNILP